MILKMMSRMNTANRDKIELHCHTMFSIDAVGTPEHLVDCAVEAGVGLLSITEHNAIGSLRRAREQAGKRGLKYLNGVEIDAFYQGGFYNFLAYDFDPDNRALNDLLQTIEGVFEQRLLALLPILQELGLPCTEPDLRRQLAVMYPGHPNPVLSTRTLGAWWRERPQPKMELNPLILSALRTLVDGTDRGADTRTGNELFFALDEKLGFFQCQFAEARDIVHDAGGVVLLAHVGKSIPSDPDQQETVIRQLIDDGMDGFELYHPSHRDDFPANREQPIFNRLSELGADLGCLLSGGSDCHDAPGSGSKAIGSCGAPADIFQRIGDHK